MQKFQINLFFYGTLLPEIASPEILPILKSLTSLGVGYMRGKLYDLGNYPGAIYDETGNWIIGRVFCLPEISLVKFFDQHEDYDPNDQDASLFIRKNVPVQMHEGKSIHCWTYLYNQTTSRFPPIESGDYLTFLNQKCRII